MGALEDLLALKGNSTLASIAQDITNLETQLEGLEIVGGSGVASEEFTVEAAQTQFTLTNTAGVIYEVHVDELFLPSSSYTLNTAKNVATVTGLEAGQIVVLGYQVATENNGLSLGETSTTAYRGDRGKTAYDHSQTAHAPSDAQKNSDITKAEIEAKLTGTISSHSHAGGGSGTSGLYGTPVAELTYNSNISFAATAVDVGTDTITAAGHGVTNGKRLCIAINEDAGSGIFTQVFPGGLSGTTLYYAVNCTTDTLQLSLTAGGAAVDITTNASMDLTKCHFEASPDQYGNTTLEITGLTAKKKYRAVFFGRCSGNTADFSLAPSNWTDVSSGNSVWAKGNFITNGMTSFGSFSVRGFCEAFFNTNSRRFAFYKGNRIAYNNTTTNSSGDISVYMYYTGAGGEDITAIKMVTGMLLNGAKLEIYDA